MTFGRWSSRSKSKDLSNSRKNKSRITSRIITSKVSPEKNTFARRTSSKYDSLNTDIFDTLKNDNRIINRNGI